MDHFSYQDDRYHCEQIAIADLVEQYGTPLYVYSRATIERHWHAFDKAFGSHPHLVCYAVKANSNIAILQLLAKLGSGFDIVSAGELERVLHAGGRANRIVFSGVGKLASEITLALDVGIRCFNVESESELHRIQKIARTRDIVAPISIRVNPDVDAGTHPYISTGLKENKFGVDIKTAKTLYQWASEQSHLKIEGIDCHIGSQLTSVRPFTDALDRVLALIDELADQGIHFQHLDIGGGLGIQYQDETPPEPGEYAEAIRTRLKNRDIEILIEPGRAIVGNAGVLVTRVEYIKHNEGKNFAIVDGAMNDLLRPALYSAWQNILSEKHPAYACTRNYDIVGPVCETGDFLGKDRQLAIEEGDLLVVRSAGAYGFTMSSNYNSRPRAAEVLVSGNESHLIRERETIPSLFENEYLLSE